MSLRAGLPLPGRDLGMNGFHERAFPHAARPPQERIIGGQAAREVLGIGEQRVAHAIDGFQKRDGHSVHMRDGQRTDSPRPAR